VEYAIDRVTGQTVAASDASARRARYRPYRCPVCGKPVGLRSGRRRIPHFAHKPGEALPDCENYHPAVGEPATPGSVRNALRTQVPHGLYALVDPVARGVPSWHLELLIPGASAPEGSVQVPDSPHGLVRVNCATIIGSGRRVEVRPQAKPYRLVGEGLSDRTYETRLQRLTPGLDLDRGNVFRWGSSASRRLEEAAPLHWGRLYIVVWAEQLTTDCPEHVAITELATRAGWNAALVELPRTPSLDTESWAERFLEREIRTEPPELELVSPPVHSIADDGLIRIPCGEDVIVAVTVPPGCRFPPIITILPPSQERREVRVQESGVTFIAASGLREGRTEFFLDHPDANALIIQPVEEPFWAVPTAEFVFRGEGGEISEVALPVFSLAARSKLNPTGDGLRKLAAVECSNRLCGTIRSRPTSTDPWIERRFGLTADVPDRVGAAQPISQLAGYLRDVMGNADVEIDFGNYGGQSYQRAQSDTVPAQLTEQLKTRMVWLLSNPGAEVPRPGGPTDARMLLGRLAEGTEEARVLERFLARERWPRSMLPHLMAIADDLFRTLGKAL
jgi:hypothetical protein